MQSPQRCNSTKSSGRTSTIWRALPPGRVLGQRRLACDQASSAFSTGCQPFLRPCATGGSTSWRPTNLAALCTPRSLNRRCSVRGGRSTRLASSSSIPRRRTSSATGTRAQEDAVAFLRLETGQSPHDRALTELVGELTTRSQDFARRWAKHNVKAHRTGVKHLRHPVVGDLHLPYEALDLSADVSLRINVYTPEPDSDEQSKLALLASWSQAPAISQ